MKVTAVQLLLLFKIYIYIYIYIFIFKVTSVLLFKQAKFVVKTLYSFIEFHNLY